MKKSFKLALACSLISVISSSFMFGVSANNDTVEVPSDGMEVVLGDTVKKGTPAIDGSKDDAYADTLTYSFNASNGWGSGKISVLYDDAYLYVFADIKDTVKETFDNFDFGVLAKDGTVKCQVVSNTVFKGEDGSTLHCRLWDPATGDIASNLKVGAESDATEQVLTEIETGYTLEFRIAYAGTKGETIRINSTDSLNSLNNMPEPEVVVEIPSDGMEVVLGDTVKKGTPAIDGSKDDVYADTLTYSFNASNGWGSGKISVLYDDAYLYVFADIEDSKKETFDNFDLGILAKDGTVKCQVVSNTVFKGDDGSTLHCRLWDPATGGIASNLKVGAESDATEHVLTETETGYTLEFRIAYAGTKGETIRINSTDSLNSLNNMPGKDEPETDKPETDKTADTTGKPSEPATDKKPDSPQTSDIGVVMSVAVLVSGASFVALKINKEKEEDR